MSWKLPLAAKNYQFPQAFMVGQIWEACRPCLSHPHVDDLIPKKAGYERTAEGQIGVSIPGISSSWSDTALFSWTLRPFQLPCTRGRGGKCFASNPGLIWTLGWDCNNLSCPCFCSWAVTFHKKPFSPMIPPSKFWPRIKTSMATWFSRIPAASRVAPFERCLCWDLPLTLGLGWLDTSDRQMKKKTALRLTKRSKAQLLLWLCWPKPVVTQHQQGGKKGKRLKIYGLDGVFTGGVWLFSIFFHNMVYSFFHLWDCGLQGDPFEDQIEGLKSWTIS